ncbi:MAG: Unknown protein [uncultured Sulfurovum sp.]|uniref:DNA-binding response regulator n=1 Tax=uncultured Sulfurovum sp. TaxID=269237 RepID=A0A6S6THQ2_9BACT|nr:MAG: Unknown protein [uncultured Sulfurovum sp.]
MMNSIAKIMIIAEDEKLMELKQLHLLKEGFEVLNFNSFYEIEQNLADINLILINNENSSTIGMEFIDYIREKDSNVPIIFLAENLSEKEIEQAFAKGADDCLVKPFGLRELVCRIKVLLKRTYGIKQERLIHQNIVLDINQRTCMVDERDIELTKLEFELLSFFMQHKNMILEREYILESVWKDISMKKRTINVSINRLLKKIDPDNSQRYFKSIRGIGYRFN